MSKTIWVPVKDSVVVAKADGASIREVDLSIAFEQKAIERPSGFEGKK